MKNEKTEKDLLKDLVNINRNIKQNLQFFFYLTVASGVLGALYAVLNSVRQ
jgi:hypothetical protein